MSKLTNDELVEMKAIGYIEGNSFSIPETLAIGPEMRAKVEAHEAQLARKNEPEPVEHAAPANKAPKRSPKPSKSA